MVIEKDEDSGSLRVRGGRDDRFWEEEALRKTEEAVGVLWRSLGRRVCGRMR